MSASLNKVTLIGHLGKDPEIRNTQSGKRIANFSLATSQNWKDKQTGERREKTEWHRIVIFSDGLAGIVEQYLKKGSKIYLEGELTTRKWQDKSGADRWTTEVVLTGFGSTMIMLDSKGNNQNENNPPRQDNNPNQENQAEMRTGDLDDEIPF